MNVSRYSKEDVDRICGNGNSKPKNRILLGILFSIVIFSVMMIFYGMTNPNNESTNEPNEKTIIRTKQFGETGRYGTVITKTECVQIFHSITPTPISNNGETIKIGDKVGIALIDENSPEENGYYVIRTQFGDDGVFEICGYEKQLIDPTSVMPLIKLPNGEIKRISVSINQLTITHNPIDRSKWNDYQWLGKLPHRYYFKI